MKKSLQRNKIIIFALILIFFAYSRVSYAKAQVSPSLSYNQIRYL